MRCLLVLFTAGFLFSCTEDQKEASEVWEIDSLYIDHVWSGHFVNFDLVTDPPYQYVAYYDSARTMTVAQRKLNDQVWTKVALPEVTGWDSHNYIAMAVDKEGVLHVSGNMHGDTLIYFMSENPHDINSFSRKDTLVGTEENEVTYPIFMENAEGDLIFQYRVGSSGKGNQIFNKYDPESRQWSRLIDQPLIDGKGEMNAYLHGPVPGPDGFYHLVWVWRDTPDAATNHHLSYAKSKNLVDWYRSNGEAQPLPITFENAEIIDPVPVKSGIINGNTMIGFDHENRPVITYHKFDQAGNTQVYNARLEKGGWTIYQTTDWRFRWEFGGYGSLNARVVVFPVKVEGELLTQKYFIDSIGVQKINLDPNNLAERSKLQDDEPVYVRNMKKVRSAENGMSVQMVTDKISKHDLYVLRWETLPPHNDQPLEDTLTPSPQPLKLYHLHKKLPSQ